MNILQKKDFYSKNLFFFTKNIQVWNLINLFSPEVHVTMLPEFWCLVQWHKSFCGVESWEKNDADCAPATLSPTNAFINS